MVISSQDSMVISSKDHVLTKVLCQEKGYGGHFEHRL